MKGLAIIGLILAIVSIIVPVYGIMYMPTIAAFIALACAFFNNTQTIVIVTVGMNLMNIFFLSFSFHISPESVGPFKNFHLTMSAIVVAVVVLKNIMDQLKPSNTNNEGRSE